MGKVLLGVSFIALVGAVIAAFSFQPPLERKLQVVNGRVTVSLFGSILTSNGVRTTVDQTADPDDTTAEASSGFMIAGSDLRFTLGDGRFERTDGGGVTVRGGFSLSSRGRTLDARDFSVVSTNDTKVPFQVVVGRGRSAFVAFDLSSPKVLFKVDDMELIVGAMDMSLTKRGAQQLGRPDLAGSLVGTLSVFGGSKTTDGGGGIVAPGEGGGHQSHGANLDVMLYNMSSLTSLGHTGTFPNGVNGLAMSTTSCNVGTGNIPWAAPMQVAHPVIAMNLYRVLNGRFEQVGWSWLKHGFFATNSNGCGTCQDPGTGSLLGPDCSDTYGTGNNGDRRYLGERKEVNPWTGVWTCTNSYFSGYQNDCVRRNDGSGLDSVAHRLIVQDADMGNAGATYYYEAYYISASDFDRYNNIGSRQATMSWNGSAWSVNGNVDGGILQGPAINRWGEMRTTAAPQTEGDVIVAVQTTSLGNGMWHYEFAAYNHDLDRQIREFIVPLQSGTVVQNIGFHDIDQDAGNQWTSNVVGGTIKWSTGASGDPNANPLMYASIFNFRFDSNRPPASTLSSLTLFKPGTGSTLTADTKGPIVLTPVESFDNVSSVTTGGNLLSLALSDDNKLALQPGILPNAGAGMGIQTSITAPVGTINSFTIGIESQDSVAPGTGGNQTVEFWNWTSSAWELLNTSPTTTADSFVAVTVSSNPGRFINGGTREVRARVLHRSGLSVTISRPFSFDQVGYHFN